MRRPPARFSLLLLPLLVLLPCPVQAVDPVPMGMTYSEMLQKAGHWSDTIGSLDPNYLTNVQKMKGIKHFVEYLSLLEELVIFGNDTVRDWGMRKVQEAIKVTFEPEYHDEVSQSGTWKAPTSYPQLSDEDRIKWDSPYEKKFRQESVSYLRAAMKIERMGLESSYYRRRVEALQPKMKGHIPRRGLIQKLAYILIYDLLNMPHPNPELKSPSATVDDQMRNVFQRSSIAARRDIKWFSTPAETERLYWLTHEVFEVTNLGRREWYTGNEHWAYALEMTRQIMRWKMEEMREREHVLSVDHLCEMVMTYAMLYREHPEDDSVTGPRGAGLIPDSMNVSATVPQLPDPNDADLLFEAINMILARYNDDGSFGTFFKKRSSRNKVNMQLHVTSVCLRGISLITRFPAIHEAYFEPELTGGMERLYPHQAGAWYVEQDLEKARDLLVEKVSDHIVRRISWVTDKSQAPDAAKARRVARLSDPSALTDKRILQQAVGLKHYKKALALLERQCSGSDTNSCGA